MAERVVYKSHTRRRVQFKPSESSSPTKQAFKDQCDINKILERWNQGQQITHINPKQPLYGDFTEAIDLQDSIDRVNLAQDAFAKLPAAVRSWANNDPVQFLELVMDPKNEEALVEMGLIDKPVQQPNLTPTVPTDTPPKAPKEPVSDPKKKEPSSDQT